MSYTNGLDKPTDYFNTVTWTGTDDATTAVTGVGFQPDWVWVKNRNVADDHMLFDAVRGVTKRLFSNSTAAEGTDAETLTSFDSDGFSTGNNRATGGSAGNGMVAWNWLAGGTASSNTDGSITSTVSANTTSGFSICAFNGNSGTVGHGLGAKPDFLVVKSRDTGGSNNWVVTHSALGTNMADKYLILNGTDAGGTSSNVWGGEPTSTTFTVTGSVAANDNNIAYLFTEKKGYSKFGSYTGNGNADGTFVYTGFKPAMLIVKRTDTTGAWVIYDNKRDTFNPADAQLVPSSSEAEATSERFDFLSNGFKLITTATRVNASGGSYIYMAFASNPFVTSTGIPTTAR